MAVKIKSGKTTNNYKHLKECPVEVKKMIVLLNFVIKNGAQSFNSELLDTIGGFTAERLKLCPICKQVFWQKKSNTQTCGSNKCINDLQNQKKKWKKKQTF